MALVVKDRVRETTTTTGTGTLTLAGAAAGFQSFSVIGDGNTTYYAITDGTSWEVGIGTYTASGSLLSRDTILESSNSGNAVDFIAGTKDVFITYPAERSVYVDGNSIVPAAVAAKLEAANGGTGQTSYAVGDVLYASGTTALSKRSIGTAGQVLQVNSGATAPEWVNSSGTGDVARTTNPVFTTPNLGTPSAATLTNATGLPLSTGVTGTLPAANGGTGQSSYAVGDLLYATGTTSISKLGIGASTTILTSSGTAPQWTAASSVAIGTATNLAGGAAGSVPYQSGAATTTFLGIGAANTVMTSSGTAPQWSTALTGLTGVSTTTATLSGNLTLSGGTANGVLYLDGSKVTTSGSALTFDGTNFATTGRGTFGQRIQVTGNTAPSTGAGLELFYDGTVAAALAFARGTGYLPLGLDGSDIRFYASSSEQMRLTSTGLGIGTSSPEARLHVVGASVLVSGSSGEYALLRGRSSDDLGFLAFQSNSGVSTYGYIGVPAANQLAFYTNGFNERMRLDSSGNLGLGVTPSAWATYRSFDLGQYGYISSGAGGWMEVMDNTYWNGSYRYKGTGNASHYLQQNGAHQWFTAPSGTAGNAISFTQAMTLDASGRLGIGTTSPARPLDVTGSMRLSNDSVVEWGGVTTTIAGSSATNTLFFTTNSTERARIDSSGNLGLGVTPSAWDAGFNVAQIGSQGALVTSTNFNWLATNWRYSSGDKYIANGFATIYRQNDGTHVWFTAPSGTAGNAISFSQVMTLDSSGNLGLGVTPSAWGAATPAYQVLRSSLWGAANNAYVGANYYYDGSNRRYIGSDFATEYAQLSGQHVWFTAPSGTAGNAIGFTQAMTLDASGNLGVGTTTLNVGTYGKAITLAATASAYGGLELSGTTGGAIEFQTSQSTRQVQLIGNSNGFLMLTNGGSGLTERARITSGGDLLVGTTSSVGARFYGYKVGDNDQLNSRFLAQNTAATVVTFLDIGSNPTNDTCYLDATGTNGASLLLRTNSTERARIPAAGGMVVGTAALATTATDGFLYVPTCAGTPTGTPTTQTGTAPIVVDTTNNKLYFYSGGQWRDAGP